VSWLIFTRISVTCILHAATCRISKYVKNFVSVDDKEQEILRTKTGLIANALN